MERQLVTALILCSSIYVPLTSLADEDPDLAPRIEPRRVRSVEIPDIPPTIHITDEMVADAIEENAEKGLPFDPQAIVNDLVARETVRLLHPDQETQGQGLIPSAQAAKRGRLPKSDQ